MGPTLTSAETARIEALLSRLEPDSGPCTVSGCLHLHDGPATWENLPALAA